MLKTKQLFYHVRVICSFQQHIRPTRPPPAPGRHQRRSLLVTLLKDLIAIPEHVHQGDFVLNLSEGVTHADAPLRDYLVTPQLVD